jgi:hypothetical protein
VIDESGEDYLYPAESFVLLDLSKEAERALRFRVKPRRAKHANKPLTGMALGSKETS